MFRFKFGEKENRRSQPREFFDKCDEKFQLKLLDKLQTIERRINIDGFENLSKNIAFKTINHIKNQKEKLFQINEKYINKQEYRLLFVKRDNIGLILNLFLKKSKSQEQREYINALDRAEYYH